MTEDLLVTEQDAADYLGMAAGTLREWRHQDTGPPYLKLPTGTVRYRQADLVTWVSQRRVVPSGGSNEA